MDDELLENDDGGGMGPLKRNAILIRARERRILSESLMILKKRKKLFHSMNFQISKVREQEMERKRLLKEKAEFKERARREFLARELLVNFHVKEAAPAAATAAAAAAAAARNFTVREGDNMERNAIMFCKEYEADIGSEIEGLSCAQSIVARAKLMLSATKTKQIIFMFPIILSNGTRTVLRMRQDDDGTEEVMKFCAVYNMTDQVCDWMRTKLAPHVEQHFKDSVLATTSLVAPDGRNLIIFLRQGDQHDLNQFVTDYVSVTKLPINVIPSITMMLERKLKPTVFEQRIEGEARLGSKLRVKRGDNAKEVVMAFGRRAGITAEAQNQVLQALIQRGL